MSKLPSTGFPNFARLSINFAIFAARIFIVKNSRGQNHRSLPSRTGNLACVATVVIVPRKFAVAGKSTIAWKRSSSFMNVWMMLTTGETGAFSNSDTSSYFFVFWHLFSMVQMYDWKKGRSSVLLGSCRVGNWHSSISSAWNFKRIVYKAMKITHGQRYWMVVIHCRGKFPG